MQLNTLSRKHERKYKKAAVGRAGKRGTTSGKGQKGQKSRAGRRIRPAVRDFIQRLPKGRGHRNVRSPMIVINELSLKQLAKFSGPIISIKTLKAAGLVSRHANIVKVLGQGELKSAVKLEGLKVSESARKKIEAAGGSIQ